MYKYIALASRVLAVASINVEVGDWCVYIDAVPGMNHDDEYEEVARKGAKLPERIAKLIFPGYAYRWRT